MPINFSELVDKIEQRNLQNRQQVVAQIKPFLDVITRKAAYEGEKRKAAEEAVETYGALGKQENVPFTPLTNSEGKYLPPIAQQTAYQANRERVAPMKSLEAFASMNNIELPADRDKWDAAKTKLYGDKLVSDMSIIKGIEAELAAYPEIAEKLYANEKFVNGTPEVKRAILLKEQGSDQERKATEARLNEFAKKQAIQYKYDVAAYSAKQEIAAKYDKDTTPQPQTTQTQKINDQILKEYHTTGVRKGDYVVRVNKHGDNDYEAIIKDGKDTYRAAANGYSYKDKGTWKPIKLDGKEYKVSKPGSNVVSEKIISSLRDGYKEYQSARRNVSQNLVNAPASIEQPAATTNPDFDDLF